MPRSKLYRPRHAPSTPLYRLLQDHLETFLAGLRPADAPAHPDLVERALQAYLECGVHRFGMVRFRCADCGESLFVAFSCKRRVTRPSCDGKRAAMTASHAMDELLPDVPYRQWVLVGRVDVDILLYVIYTGDMEALKTAREAAGLSQRALAARAGVAFRTVQLLEWGRHDARLSTVERINRALGRAPTPSRLTQPGPSAADACAAVLHDGVDSWKGHLFDFVDAFRRSPSLGLVETAPPAETDPRVLALIAATVEHLCADGRLRPPWWCAGIPSLPEPWFVAGMESLKASALVEAPAAFRRRNVFVLANFLERA